MSRWVVWLVRTAVAVASFVIALRCGAFAAAGAEGVWEIPVALLVVVSVTVTLYTTADLLSRRRSARSAGPRADPAPIASGDVP